MSSDDLDRTLAQAQRALADVLARRARRGSAEHRTRVLEARMTSQGHVEEAQKGKQPYRTFYEPPAEVTEAEHGAIVPSPT